ncbi:MAG: bifunctional diguanylate cyclase/phosphodiesterase [Ilumatobacteraceae bacterium]
MLARPTRRARTRLQHQAKHDGLTSVANRRYFNEKMEGLFAGRFSPSGAVLLIDLDDFKRINDTHGHPAGDAVLAILAQRISATVRASDLVARIGGDEFAVVLTGTSDSSIVRQRARAIVSAVRQPIHANGLILTVRSSIGAARIDSTITSPDALLRAADAALYRFKSRGKDQYVVFDADLRREELVREQMVGEIADAVRDRGFGVSFQPVHDLVTGEIVAVEALARWKHPSRGTLRPAEFLSLAESVGLVTDVGEQVLDQALEQLSRINAAVPAHRRIRLHVNFSAAQLADVGLVSEVERMLRSHGVEPTMLVVEATDAWKFLESPPARDTVRRLAERGVQFGLDDFGTGFSSSTQLLGADVDVLKIGRSLTRQIGTDARTTALLGSIVHFANALSLVAIAEGVETLDQLDELRRQGCRFGQGFLLSTPLSGDELFALATAGAPGNHSLWSR